MRLHPITLFGGVGARVFFEGYVHGNELKGPTAAAEGLWDDNKLKDTQGNV